MNENKTSELGFRIKVFLVDDQFIVYETLRRMLIDDNDIELIYCQEPADAITKAIESKPTLILQDLVMPDIEGLTLVKFYRSTPELRDIPIIVLSSKEEATTKAEAFEYGANDYLVKLPDKIELIARIRYHSKAYINLLERNLAYESLEKSQNALASELSKAGDYVVSLLPSELKTNEVDTCWKFIPSAQLGGDAFGYHWIDEDNFAMYLLDVCGHGVGSALMSVSALNVLRTQTFNKMDYYQPASLMNSLNKTFQMSEHNGLYFTIWYGIYNKKTHNLKFAAGGHPPAFIIDRNSKVIKLKNENFIIGGIPDFPYSDNEIFLEPPFSIYIYSDGVYEIEKPDNNIWEMDEMIDFISANHTINNQDINQLFEYVKNLSGKNVLDDDFSMVKINIKE